MFIVLLATWYLSGQCLGDNFLFPTPYDEKIYVDIGTHVNLSCAQPVNINHLISCIWDRFDLNGLKNLERSAYNYGDTGERTNCVFELKNVTAEDLTSWTATMNWKLPDNSTYGQGYKICKVQLIPRVAPEYVLIQNKSAIEMMFEQDGDEVGNNAVTLKCCVDKTTAPPPELTFVYDDKTVQNTFYDEEECCLIWPKVTFHSPDNHKEVKCILKHPMLSTNLTDSMTLNVQSNHNTRTKIVLLVLGGTFVLVLLASISVYIVRKKGILGLLVSSTSN